MQKHFLATMVWAILVSVLSGCSLINASTSDKSVLTRSLTEHWSDKAIEQQIANDLNNLATPEGYRHRIGVNVFLNNVLLTGEVPNQKIADSIGQYIVNMPNIENVYEHFLILDRPYGQSQSLYETYLKTQLEAELLKNRHIKSAQYQLVVRNGVALFLGEFTKDHMKELSYSVQGVDGIISAYAINVQSRSIYNIYSDKQLDLTNTVLKRQNRQDNSNKYSPHLTRAIRLPTPVSRMQVYTNDSSRQNTD